VSSEDSYFIQNYFSRNSYIKTYSKLLILFENFPLFLELQNHWSSWENFNFISITTHSSHHSILCWSASISSHRNQSSGIFWLELRQTFWGEFVCDLNYCWSCKSWSIPKYSCFHFFQITFGVLSYLFILVGFGRF
jgi:hypothetical protein